MEFLRSQSIEKKAGALLAWRKKSNSPKEGRRLSSLTALFVKPGVAVEGPAGLDADTLHATQRPDQTNGGCSLPPSRKGPERTRSDSSDRPISSSLMGQMKTDLEVLKTELVEMSSDVQSAAKVSTGKLRTTFKFMLSLTQSGIHKDYIIREAEYGKGHYGVVKCAQNRWDGRDAAVKILAKRDAWGTKESALISREIDIMRDLDHPNCILMHGHYESKTHVYIVMEPVTGGQLLERLIAKSHYSETEAARAFVQIIGAVKYLHQIGVVHRDLKPENILYASEDPDAPLKICDFGLSTRVVVDSSEEGGQGGARPRLWSKCGSPDYVAPEVLGDRGYGPACDVWSCGVILYVLLSGTAPFGYSSVGTKFDHIRQGRYAFTCAQWRPVSAAAKDLVCGMLQTEVTNRHTANACLEHVWVRGFLEDQLSKDSMLAAQKAMREWGPSGRTMYGARDYQDFGPLQSESLSAPTSPSLSSAHTAAADAPITPLARAMGFVGDGHAEMSPLLDAVQIPPCVPPGSPSPCGPGGAGSTQHPAGGSELGVDQQPGTVRLTLPKVSKVGSRGAIGADGHMQPAFGEGGGWSLGNSERNAVDRPWCARRGGDEEEGGRDAGRGEEPTVADAFCAALLL